MWYFSFPNDDILNQQWNSEREYFQHVSLKSLGQVIQLGHPTGEACINSEPCYSSLFTVLNTNGMHDIILQFCNCETKQAHYVQLLRFGWFLATVSFPHTALTLRLLKHFQILSFEPKLTVYKYHQTLQCLTDNTGTQPKQVCLLNLQNSENTSNSIPLGLL